MSESNKYLITGIGNPGPDYRGTRHNAGFRIVSALANEGGVTFEDKRYGWVAEMRVKNKILVLLKPSTYVNLSGDAVRYWMKKEKIPLENLLVVVDDLNIPFGDFRLRSQGSSGGHNGLKHIERTLGTQRYARLRFGIGSHYARGSQIDYVLGTFDEEEESEWPNLAALACEAIKCFALEGIDRTMNTYNKSSIRPSGETHRKSRRSQEERE